ncbi:hypothetical protein HUU42_13505 [bacterium]|nr:hypothetical protein [bacterium]
MSKTILFLLISLAVSNINAQDSSLHNLELYNIFMEDQADRQKDIRNIDGGALSKRDAERRKQVKKIIDKNGLATAEDYFRAAMIFQHGQDTNDYKLSHTFALNAVRLDSSHSEAKWLSAASWDRYLMNIGKPQWYGTQFQIKDNRCVLYEVDTTKVSDFDRIRLNVPTLAQARARADLMTKEFQKSDTENEKEFLKSSNSELYKAYLETKKEKRPANAGSSYINQIKKLIKKTGLKSPEDYFFAAYIFNKNADEKDSTNYKTAHDFALKSLSLGLHESLVWEAKYLVAQTKDNYLMSIGQSQCYGTKVIFDQEKMSLAPIDSACSNDNERTSLGLPSLDVMKSTVEKHNKNLLKKQ